MGKEWDLARTGRFGMVGALVQTTLLHCYLTKFVPHLKISQKRIPDKVTRSILTIILRLSVHLSVMMPFRIGVIFFALHAL